MLHRGTSTKTMVHLQFRTQAFLLISLSGAMYNNPKRQYIMTERSKQELHTDKATADFYMQCADGALIHKGIRKYTWHDGHGSFI